MTSIWQDRDRRRAALLSILVHVAGLLALVLFVALPRPTPLEPFVVIDVGSPAPSDVPIDAATVDEPAPEADAPQVAADSVGRPAAAPAPEPVETPPAAEQAEEEPQEEPVQAEEEPQEEPVEQAEAPADEQAEAPAPEQAAEPVEAEAPPVEEPVEEPQEAAPPRPAAPAPMAPPPTPVAESLPGAPATPLPEIEQEVLAPRPLAESIPVPMPSVAAELPEVRDISPQPRAEVAAPQEVPRPSITAQVPDERAVPTPTVSAEVPEERDVPTPMVQANVAAPQAVPRPDASAQVATPRSVPRPAARAEVAPPAEVPRPAARAEVAESRAVPQPAARAEVAEASNVPSPAARAEVADARDVPQPSASAEVASAVPVPTPSVSAAVPSARNVPTPEVRASVAAPATRDVGVGAANVAEGADDPRGNRPVTGPEGGNALQAGQPDPPAEGQGEGFAAAPGRGQSTGVQARPEPYSAFRREPVAVLLDNANGYPQSGLVEAAVVVEMPVEGGITRLMPLYDSTDPPNVGPVRSARDYFVRVAESYDSVLVHDGGSPSALQAIAQSPTPTLNAFNRGELFVRVVERNAPYNLYSAGNALRSAVNRIRASGMRPVSGTIYRPPEEAREVEDVTVRYGGTYQTGFSYQSTLASYRWVRNGTPAVDAQGEQVRAQAVLVAGIDARPFPDDPEGRLYIPLDGGPATLYILGRAIDGTWSLDEGIRFQAEDGSLIDLRPFKTWMAFTPTYGTRAEN